MLKAIARVLVAVGATSGMALADLPFPDICKIHAELQGSAEVRLESEEKPGGPDAKPRVLQLIDPKAGPLTVALYQNLARVAEKQVLFGHQNTLAYGYRWVNEPGRSDVRDVTGSYPALYGWDLEGFEWPENRVNVYSITPEKLLRWSREGYERGGVITYSWHQGNPVTGKTFYDTTRAAHTLLPGGSHHGSYRATLDKIGEFFRALDPIPVIFRPYHEHNGDWFWWGKALTTEEEYVALWRFTVDYLRDEKDVHNLIYAYSPDRSRMDMRQPEASYFYGYPGDDYVDILGLDNYWDVGHPQNPVAPEEAHKDFVESLELVVRLAEERGKLAALTETGSDALHNPEWWTKVLLAGLDATPETRKIAYAQVWRNGNREIEGRDHFYVPYPGHPSSEDFIRFKTSPLILFEDELPDLYASDPTTD